ncbi:hypothetical protein [Micromonospora sp. NPDC049102]
MPEFRLAIQTVPPLTSLRLHCRSGRAAAGRGGAPSAGEVLSPSYASVT